jgi:hypothetical protein
VAAARTADISEECIGSTVHVKGYAKEEISKNCSVSCWFLIWLRLQLQKSRCYIPVKYQWTSTKLHGITTQKKIVLFWHQYFVTSYITALSMQLKNRQMLL